MAPTENTDDPNAQFSRYTGEDDDRGASMVAKHLKAQVANNREAALATLKAVWPLVRRPGPRVHGSRLCGTGRCVGFRHRRGGGVAQSLPGPPHPHRAARGWARPPCSHSNNQFAPSCRLGSAFDWRLSKPLAPHACRNVPRVLRAGGE
jgi:hypothetical protein